MTDPVEKVIHDALTTVGIRYEIGKGHKALDMHLPDLDTYIECKRFHTPRTNDQLSRHENVIVIQGMGAAKAFHQMLTKKEV